jgi:signal transduction histidine kinase
LLNSPVIDLRGPRLLRPSLLTPDQRIAKRKVELLFENVLVSQGFSVVNASIVALLRYDEQPGEMTVWWSLVMAAAILRLTAAYMFRARRADLSDPRWIRLKGALALVSGLIWGAGGAVILRSGTPWAVMVSAFTIAGMSAAAVPLLSAELWIYLGYSATMLAPCLIALLTLPLTKWTATVILMTVLFWLTLISSARRFANALRREVEREAELAVGGALGGVGSRAKSAFLANMSHEIRTPMNGLLGIAEVLSLMELGEKEAELVEVLGRAGHSMMAVLTQILNFSQLESGHYDLIQKPCSPAALVRDVVQMYEATAHLKGLALHHDVAPDVPDRVLSSAQDIANVMTILVGNAVKFTEKGSIDLAVWSGREEGRAMLYVSVADTGPGIAEAAQAKLFKAFTQADESITRSFGGVGLGLATAHRIARLMGGTINVESTLGQGSRFFFAIPVTPL